MPPGMTPAAMAAALPLDDPPVKRLVSHGFLAGGQGSRSRIDDAGLDPGAAGGHQETDRDGGDETPEHFVGMPGQSIQRAARQLRREYPDRHREQRP